MMRTLALKALRAEMDWPYHPHTTRTDLKNDVLALDSICGLSSTKVPTLGYHRAGTHQLSIYSDAKRILISPQAIVASLLDTYPKGTYLGR